MLCFIIQILSVFVELRYENMFFACLPNFYILTEILNSALPSCCSSCDVSRSSDALPTIFCSDIDFVRSIAYGSCCFDANGLTQNCVRFLLCVAYGSSCWRCPQNKAQRHINSRELAADQGNKELVQLKEYQKDLEYRLHHRLSKFDRSVFLILKPISYFFGMCMAWFFIQKLLEFIRS